MAKEAKVAQKQGMGEKIAQAKDFFEESQAEIKKVVWPTKKETTAASIAVFLVVVVMGAFLALADMLFSRAIQAILS